MWISYSVIIAGKVQPGDHALQKNHRGLEMAVRG
jgi:hypothetical protein